jgi:hypothetical protein
MKLLGCAGGHLEDVISGPLSNWGLGYQVAGMNLVFVSGGCPARVLRTSEQTPLSHCQLLVLFPASCGSLTQLGDNQRFSACVPLGQGWEVLVAVKCQQEHQRAKPPLCSTGWQAGVWKFQGHPTAERQ